MPIPTLDACTDDFDAETCCNTFFLIGQRILQVAWSGLAGCIDADCSDREFRTFVTFGERIQDPLGDSLIVALANATSASLTTTPRNRLFPASVTQLIWRVELRDNGFPTIERNQSGQIEVPDWRAFQHATQHTMDHGEMLWRTLVDAGAQRSNGTRMFPLPANGHVLQGGVNVGSLRPIGPQAFQAGWAVDVTVDVKLDALASPSGS